MKKKIELSMEAVEESLKVLEMWHDMQEKDNEQILELIDALEGAIHD